MIYNIALSEVTPNIMAKDHDGLLMESPDTRHFFYLDPFHVQKENIFLSISKMKVNQSYWDFFEFTESEIEFTSKADI